MRYIFALFFLLFAQCAQATSLLTRELALGRASDAAQNESWDDAQNQLKPLLCDNPDDCQVLYDLGVASYRKKEYAPAYGYFRDAAAQGGVSQKLKLQSLVICTESSLSIYSPE